MEDMKPIDMDRIGPDTEPLFGDVKDLALKGSRGDCGVPAVQDSKLDRSSGRNPAVFTTFLVPEFFKDVEHVKEAFQNDSSIRKVASDFKLKKMPEVTPQLRPFSRNGKGHFFTPSQ